MRNTRAGMPHMSHRRPAPLAPSDTDQRVQKPAGSHARTIASSWALGVGVGVVAYARPLAWRLAGALYPAAVCFTIVATGNHFVLDAVAGMGVLGAGFAAAAVLESRLRRGVEQSGSSPGS